MKTLSLTKNWSRAVVISLCVIAATASASSNKPSRRDDKQKKQQTELVTTSHSLINENNQSIADQSSSEGDQRKVQSRHFQEAFDSSLAHIFRMNSRPKWNQSSVRIPEFMLNLYNDQFSEEARNSARSSDTAAGRRKRHSYPAANTIRSFNSEGQFRTGLLGARAIVYAYIHVLVYECMYLGMLIYICVCARLYSCT